MIPFKQGPKSRPLQLLKLGGSLITEKNRPHTVRQVALARLAGEIAAAYRLNPEMHLLLGHGAGSFAHVPARQYGTRQGVRTPAQWQGFVEVWREAAQLNHLVMEALSQAGLPAISLPPSASVRAAGGKVFAWDLGPLQAALQAGLLPVIFGDVIFDSQLGGTILSTEDLFGYIVPQLQPARVLLAGLEAGVWADYPACTRLLQHITPESYHENAASIGASAAVDVTGGMASKVAQALDWVQGLPGLEVLIFSGETPGILQQALQGESVGTVLLGN